MPVANLSSVMRHGILCHEKAAALAHGDISMAAIQERRDRVRVPGGLMLHQYANLYLDARNPMMYKRRDQVDQLCVLSITATILQVDDVVVADQNASSDYVRFYSADGIGNLDLDLVYADDWRHPNQIAYWRHKSAKCAEVLVPSEVPAGYIQKAYVASNVARSAVLQSGFSRPVEFMPRLFFR
tara:strand:+ start:18870 stop:19421 length:552 start_codon:yes stop_codon:yes gene_type:complete